MVTKYGMSNLGPIALEGTGGRMIGGGMSEDRGYSPQIAKAIDDEVSKIIEEAKQKAKDILTKYRGALDVISVRLAEYESLLKSEGVEIQDAYKKQREEEEKEADPTKGFMVKK
jgi:cell division protease FtsH